MSSSVPVGRAKSCVTCRQFKLACDARKTTPDPCTRCVDKNRQCRFNPKFKRISTRRITQEVANELHELRAAHRAKSASGNTPGSQLVLEGQSPALFGGNRSVSSHGSSSQQPPPSGSFWLQLSDDEVVLDQTFQSMTIEAKRVLKVFYHFDRYYYPHACFLPQVKSINQLAVRSPLLFWTILLVASERYEGHDDLYDQLYTAHDTLLSEILHVAIQKLDVVHALMILCLWPVPKMRNVYDPSWNYIGLAIQAATSLNCHHPVESNNLLAHYKGAGDTSAAEMDPSNQAMTWLYCFTISARLSAYLGLIPPICSPQHAKSLKRAQVLAADLLTPEEKASIKILEIFCEAQVHLETIDNNVNTQYSMLDAYESRLEAVKQSVHSHWSWSLEVCFQAIRLFILGIGLLPVIAYDDHQALIYRETILHRCLDAASAYISTLTNMSYQPASGSRYPSGILTFYPKHYFTTLMAAASHIFRFLISARGINQAQQSLAMTRLTEAHKIFQSFPDHRDAVRGCINIEMYVNAIRTSPIGNLTSELVVKNRLGASIMADALFRAAQQRNLDVVNGTTPPVANWSMMSDDNMHRLPLAPEQRVVSPRSQQPLWSENNAAFGIWETYANDYSVLDEPWIGTDAEFASVMAMTGQATADLQANSGFPASALR